MLCNGSDHDGCVTHTKRRPNSQDGSHDCRSATQNGRLPLGRDRPARWGEPEALDDARGFALDHAARVGANDPDIGGVAVGPDRKVDLDIAFDAPTQGLDRIAQRGLADQTRHGVRGGVWPAQRRARESARSVWRPAAEWAQPA